MEQLPKEIKASEVRVGDTIRYSRESEVKRVIDYNLALDLCNGTTITAKLYTITLLNRPLPQHKYKVGQKVKTDDGKLVVIKALRCMGHLPCYDITPTDAYWYLYKESELNPIEEPAWEPKFGDWVKYIGTQVNTFKPGTKSLITGFDLYVEPKEVYLELEGGDAIWTPVTNITKWEDE